MNNEQKIAIIMALVTNMVRGSVTRDGVSFQVYDALLSFIRQNFGPDAESYFDHMVESTPAKDRRDSRMFIEKSISLIPGFASVLRTSSLASSSFRSQPDDGMGDFGRIKDRW